MNPLDRLSEYLRAVERRLRVLAWTRGAAIACGVALLSTVILVLIANSYAFSSGSLLASRTALYLSLALALGAGLLVPLLRLNDRRAAREAEQKFPEFEQRLLTFSECAKAKAGDPFLELLAADTLATAQNAEPARVARPGRIWGFASIAGAALAVLLWMGMAGPGFWGYGTALLWAGPSKVETQAFYDIVVQPGNRTVRRKSDQLVTAQTVGFTTPRARLFVKYASAAKWEEAAMRPQPNGPNHEFLFSGIPEPLEYYVEAGGVHSKTYKLSVVDLPAVKRIKVTYHYPSWSGMKDAVEDPGGDLRAVEGTTADVEIATDRPLPNGVILLDDGTRIPLRGGVARVPIQKDGLYHVASVERGAEHGTAENEDVRLTDDYFIEASKDNPPTVRIRRPGHDAKANPVEEVTVEVEAEDDFGLRDVSLVYSVNGGPEKTIPILKDQQRKTVEGKTLLSLEDFNLVPGDVVSLYATAKDARNTSRTDIFFVEAEPFEREYSQSQQAGGGGGEGDEAQQGISKRQKEIIAATWNQIKDSKQDKTSEAEAGKFLSEVQSKLRDQAQSLANRMKSRELSGTNQEFQQFSKDMEAAVQEMGPATEKLHGKQWREALAPEQKALQYLLRAEAVFRQIQVAFGQSGGGGGGGSGRDLENLFDLELDTEKNQYESGQQQSSQDQRKKEIDEALQKLEQLAKRQQELADQQKQNPRTPQQRWQQEMLRREAEQLQHKMEQLSRSGQQQGQQQQGQQQQGQAKPGQGGPGGQQGQGQQSSQQSAQGGPGQQSQEQQRQQQEKLQQAMRQNMQRSGQNANQQQLDRAIERLKEATRDMQSASSSQQAGSPQSEAEARRAAERLQEARDLVSGMRKQQGGQQIGDLAREAEDLAAKHQEFGKELRKEFGSEQANQTREKNEQLAGESEALLKQLKELEKQMQQAARDLAATDREASAKVRRALGDMQQDELARNLSMSAEAIRRGYGAWAAMREATTTQSLNKLRDRMKELEAAGVKGAKPGDKGLQQALDQAENLRRQMEQATRAMNQGQKGQTGQQGQGQQGKGQQSSGQGQPGQQGQAKGGGQQGGQSGQQQGQAPGQQGQQGGQQPGQSQAQSQSGGGQSVGGQQFGPGSQSSGEGRQAGPTYGGSSGGYDGMNRGQRFTNDGGLRGSNPAIAEQAYRETLRDLGRLRDNVADNPDIARDVNDLMREMQRIDPRRFGQEPLLADRINAQVLSSLEQIELQLRRKVEEQQGGNVRSGASEAAPPGYANPVADYFRKLSKEK